MKKFLLALLVFCPAVFADPPVPRCWRLDLPGEDIEDGLFRIFIPTADTSARDVAMVLGVTSQALAVQVGVGTSRDLGRVEIDMLGEVKYWRPTAAFPTLAEFKSAILGTLEPALRRPGVSIQCAKINRHRH